MRHRSTSNTNRNPWPENLFRLFCYHHEVSSRPASFLVQHHHCLPFWADSSKPPQHASIGIGDGDLLSPEIDWTSSRLIGVRLYQRYIPIASPCRIVLLRKLATLSPVRYMWKTRKAPQTYGTKRRQKLFCMNSSRQISPTTSDRARSKEVILNTTGNSNFDKNKQIFVYGLWMEFPRTNLFLRNSGFCELANSWKRTRVRFSYQRITELELLFHWWDRWRLSEILRGVHSTYVRAYGGRPAGWNTPISPRLSCAVSRIFSLAFRAAEARELIGALD